MGVWFPDGPWVPGSDAQRASWGELPPVLAAGPAPAATGDAHATLQHSPGERQMQPLQTFAIPHESAELDWSNSLPRLLALHPLWVARLGSCPVVEQTLDVPASHPCPQLFP